MVSIEDVATRAGVSVATVSRALRGLSNVAPATRRRVEAAARELDYVPSPSASRLAAGRTTTVGVVLPSLGTWYHGQVLAAVHATASQQAHDVLALVVDDVNARERFLRDLPFRKRVDSLLIVDVPFSDDELDGLRATGVAVVVTGTATDAAASVGIDDRAAGHEVIEHLLSLGHRDVACIEGSISEPFRFSGPNGRRRGVADALALAGIEPRPERRVVADWTAEGGATAMGELLDAAATPPTAVFAFSDDMAIGAIGELRRHDLAVPGDVSVMGFDDHELGVHLGLTTVHQPVRSIGVRATERLLDEVRNGRRTTSHEVLPTRLVVRSTTSSPRADGDSTGGDSGDGDSGDGTAHDSDHPHLHGGDAAVTG